MTKEPIKVYIAGPMTGYDDYNMPAFLEAKETLMKAWNLEEKDIFNPGESEQSLMVQQGLVRGQEAYRICMEADLVWIARTATHMFMLQGWERSPGARCEHALAVCLSLTIIYQ